MNIAHIGLLVSDLERAAAFYEQMLGLQRIERPQLNFDGLWYGLDAGQQIHLMLLDSPYTGCDKPDHGGRDNHIAMQVEDFDGIRQRLDAAGITTTQSKSGRTALFCRDPDGNTFELIPAS
ncbi:MAG: glyoxalase [Zetaproteobacteria bacterium CG12_big_fil_rev_8_21_14_0_65_54_13]|nr:MAG: glyoxalase [Zetaproteobacteria bacterium CG23_combo_of_CG06-09_8_20_14_all_54_7]PIW48235.1 MAG: glyoxalase [Zetaproteobacteria bacterium CG12_big_fil_rev_8_21_14_0_65_54_13]PIX54536.1 MAG: glyoxalase [Zetaproteobacteria bacterium CG_4_10_14_3_um_filter_54_28]PJA29747.1 MAG: glyoxalase [Zetaproteobacteria bacterium CG_4_9_14_3_um_filter_54_145]